MDHLFGILKQGSAHRAQKLTDKLLWWDKRLARKAKHRIKDPGRRLILRHLWNERRLFFLTVVLAFLGAAFEGVGLGLLIPFIESLTSPGAQPWQTGIDWVDIYLLAVNADPSTRLFRVSGLILGTIFARAGLNYLSAIASVNLQENVVAKLRREVIDQVQAVSLRFFAKTRMGDILNTLTTEVQRTNRLFSTSHTLLVQGSMALIYTVAVFALSWPLALIALALCCLLFLVMNGIIGYLRQYSRDISRANAEVAAIATELIRGIRTVILSGTQRYEADRFRKAAEHTRDLSIRLGTKEKLTGPLSQFIASTALIAIVIVAMQFFVLPGYMSSAMLLTFLFALFRLLPLVQKLNGLRAQWAYQRGALEDLSAFLTNENKPYLPDGTRKLGSFRYSIELEDVSFAYREGETVLKNVSLTIERGQTVALVGASGAGKTTLADLVARLYDPTCGRILLDGTDLREYRLASLRSKISVVSQDTFLFNDTVWNNLTYGLGNVSDEHVRWAAEQANAIDFVENLERGFDTLLGDRGTLLSGGQRQRIAIARALARNPEILILDEATSALDSVSESAVQQATERLMEDRTVVVIAHRLSTIENADVVVVLEQGEIVEQGTYQELLDLRGQLWEYHKLQYRMDDVMV
jgi:subfamily B ATP-binding cassette protein MsbA